MNQLILKPRAIKMMHDSYKYYESQKLNLGEEFIEEVEKLFLTIKLNPLLFSAIQQPYHQAPLKRFPFVIVYQVIKKDIIVYAVFHTKRNPKRKY